MKTKTLLSLLLLIGLSQKAALAQNETPPAPESPEQPGKPNAPDTTRLKFGNVRMVIYEEQDSVDVKVSNDEKEKSSGKGKFNNWSGFYIGVNGAMTFDNKFDMDTIYKDFELDYARSLTLGINFGDFSIPIVKDHLAITSGFGFQWNRYAFKRNTDLGYTADTLVGIQNMDVEYTKNILRACYLQIPLLIDINTHKNEDKSLHISAGIIGGYRLGSKVKQKYEIEGQTFKNKIKGHYHLSPLQAYLHGQIGYGDITFFANYGLTRVFEKGKGPQLYPFTAGIKFLF